MKNNGLLHPTPMADAGIEDIVRSFPLILDNLQRSYSELEQRALRVENELCRANEELERKVWELDALKGHLEAVLDSLPTGVVVRDTNGTIVRVNGATSRILGESEAELLGRREHPALRAEVSDGEAREVTVANGRRAFLASSYSPIVVAADSDGTQDRLDGSVEIIEDCTERKRLTERLHAADKMAALGTMAAGIAHEIRNPLNAIKGFASLLVRQGLTDPLHERWAHLIVEGSIEADAIIENMLTFGSPERLRLEEIDGEELLESAVRTAFGEIVERGALDIRIENHAPAFTGDRIKLRQALRNLLVNAADAMGNKGPLKLILDFDEGEIVATVSDSGPGISSEVRQKVLDPFFTTRAEGTGLGLALVSTIAQLHGGNVQIHSEPSPLGGAQISLHIPCQSPPSDG